MKELLLDVFADTIKILPYLLVTFILLELLEHKFEKKSSTILVKSRKVGPLIGSMIGAIPQCGFSTAAASLFSSRIITIGTIIAVFLSTSDEMIPIMISEKAPISLLIKIVLFKALVGVIVGFIVDLIFKKKNNEVNGDISHMCEEDHCSCKEDGVILSSIKHTLKIGLFILIANLLISLVIHYIGEDTLSNILLNKSIVSYFIASLVGLIPNCASSVIITELYLENLITIGNLLSGLLTGSGLGILLLFKNNKNIKENILILSIIYFIGVVLGIVVDLII